MSPFVRERIALALWSILLFAICWRLDIRHSRFPYYYHPDEPGKTEQLRTHDWNFHHPMLLLTATEILVKITGTPMDDQALVEAGRRVSAAFAAAAVVAFSLVAFLWRGWFASFLTGGALLLHHQVYELSHYMKEDTALLMGVALTCLAALAYAQLATPWRAVALGAACAVAVSGKYVGVVALAFAVPAFWSQPSDRRRHAASAAVGFLVVLVALNQPLFWHPGAFRHSFDREMVSVIEGQGDTTRRVPHALYWNVFLDNSSPFLWLFLIGFVIGCWQRREQLFAVQWAIIAFPFLYTLALSFSPKENDRYFLPATGVFTLLACLGAQDAPRLVSQMFGLLGLKRPDRLLAGRWKWEAMLAGALGILVLQLTGWSASKPGWLQYDSAFERNDMTDLIAWMTVDLPPGAFLAADARTGLPDLPRNRNVGRTSQVPQKVMVSRLASDFGSLDELRAMGVTHVAVSESSYGRFFRPDLHPKEAKERKYLAARSFYEELLRGEPVFDRERGTVIYLHPGIRVYRLGGAKAG